MITTKFYTKYGVFELTNDNCSYEEIQDSINIIIEGQFTRLSGFTTSGTHIIFTKEVLKDCIIEIIK